MTRYDPGCFGTWDKAGWWVLNPGETKQAFTTSNEYGYYYAEATDGAIWSGPYGDAHDRPPRHRRRADRPSVQFIRPVPGDGHQVTARVTVVHRGCGLPAPRSPTAKRGCWRWPMSRH
jgi:hypothetical protein